MNEFHADDMVEAVGRIADQLDTSHPGYFGAGVVGMLATLCENVAELTKEIKRKREEDEAEKEVHIVACETLVTKEPEGEDHETWTDQCLHNGEEVEGPISKILTELGGEIKAVHSFTKSYTIIQTWTVVVPKKKTKTTPTE